MDLQAFVGKALAPPNNFALKEEEWRKGEDTAVWDVSAAALPFKNELVTPLK